MKLQIKLNDSERSKFSSEKTNLRQEKIIEVIALNRGLGISGIFEQLNSKVHKETLKKDLSHLVREDLIQRKGRGRGTWYEV